MLLYFVGLVLHYNQISLFFPTGTPGYLLPTHLSLSHLTSLLLTNASKCLSYLPILCGLTWSDFTKPKGGYNLMRVQE